MRNEVNSSALRNGTPGSKNYIPLAPILVPGFPFESLRGRFPGKKRHGGKKKMV